jgi:hypothetical protein
MNRPYKPENKFNINPTEFLLDEIYQRQFGTFTLPYRQTEQKFDSKSEEFGAIALAWQAEPWGDFKAGPKGQIYRMPIALRKTQTVDGAAGPWFQLPNEPMVSVRGSVEITKTTINRSGGKRGTVTEEEHLEDYQVTIQGIAYNEIKNAYPEEDMKQIRYLFETPGYVEVKNYLLNQIYGIQFVKIQAMKADRFERLTERWQPYTLDCYSVFDFDLS